jgi:carboxyl-terminal processing protease
MKRAAGIAGVTLLVTGAFALGLLLTRAHGTGSTLSVAPRDEPPSVIDEVRRQLVEAYYRPVPSALLAKESIGEILSGLRDPYTEYLNRVQYMALTNTTAASYSGVGLTLRPGKGGLLVKTALQGPAREAGIRPGDLIVSIDGRGIRRLPFDRSLELFHGERGTTVKLTIRRPREGMLTFTVERSDIALPIVRSRLLKAGGGRVGYVKLLSFRANAADTVAARVAALRKRGAKGIVLDLRGNPGGLLSQAVGTVSLFVSNGLVCVTEGVRHGRRDYDVTGNAPHADLPLVVLVDRNTASAAEVVAAALEDHNRALVAGEATFGKAAVQSVRQLSNGAALKLTTAVFRTPSGLNLTGRGLSPDVEMLDVPSTQRDEALRSAAHTLLEQLSAAS